jgi:hypothetical protein
MANDLDMSNFSIQDTMEMGMGNQELLQGLFEPETASSNPEDVQPIINEANPPAAPVNSTLPEITGSAIVTNVLTTDDGTWTGSPTSYAYQWKRGATNIGTNANTYTLVNADAGQSITCVVTATNGGGSTPATSNAVQIQNFYRRSKTQCNQVIAITGLNHG